MGEEGWLEGRISRGNEGWGGYRVRLTTGGGGGAVRSGVIVVYYESRMFIMNR